MYFIFLYQEVGVAHSNSRTKVKKKKKKRWFSKLPMLELDQIVVEKSRPLDVYLIFFVIFMFPFF